MIVTRAGLLACMEDERNAFRVSVGKPGRKRLKRRDRCIWEGNMKLILENQDWGLWTGLIWFRMGISGRLL
jgi:hypothetical protein